MGHHGTLDNQRVYAAKNRAYYRRYGVSYYQANKEYFRSAKRKARYENRLLINDLKNTPCLDCGRSYSPWVMQFDHREPGNKLFNVGAMATRPKKAIFAEAAKCDVVCANCHADRTHNRGRA